MKKVFTILISFLMIASMVFTACSNGTGNNTEHVDLKDFYIYLEAGELYDRRPVAKITVNTVFTTEEQIKELQDLLDKEGRRALGEKILKDYLEEFIPARFDGISYPVEYHDDVTDVSVKRHDVNWTKTVTLKREFKLDGLAFDHTIEMKSAVPKENDCFDTNRSSSYINDDLPYLDGRLTMKGNEVSMPVSQDGKTFYYEQTSSFLDRIQADFCYYEVEIYGAPSAFSCTIDE